MFRASSQDKNITETRGRGRENVITFSSEFGQSTVIPPQFL